MDYVTYTCLGRNKDSLLHLFDYFPENASSGLIVGAGRAYDCLLNRTGPILGFDPEQMFSWEYIEVLSLLKRTDRDATVTIVDPCQEVCETVLAQTEVPIHDFFGHTSYIEILLESLPHDLASHGEICRINERLRDLEVVNQVTKFAKVSLDPDRVTVIPEDPRSLAKVNCFDVATMLETVRYSKDRERVFENIGRALNPGGVVLVSDSKLESRPSGLHGLTMLWSDSCQKS